MTSNSRLVSLDLARGFTVLAMPMIHTVMLYSKPEVQRSFLGDILGFIAEGPGAQLFMLLMGVHFAGSRGRSRQRVFKRVFLLFVAAFGLNAAKFLPLLGLGLMSGNLLIELELKGGPETILFFLFMGDILLFAAIAQLVLWAVNRLKNAPFWALLLATGIVFLSPFIWDLSTGMLLTDYILALFGGHPPAVFFPVFPWIVYPLVGLAIGYGIKGRGLHKTLKQSAGIGSLIIVLSLTLPATSPNTVFLDFYRTRPADTLFHIGLVLLWVSAFHWLSKKIKPNIFFTLLIFCSKHITVIYIIQWILICWCLAITGYLQLNMKYTLVWMLGITVITLALTHIIHLLKQSPSFRRG